MVKSVCLKSGSGPLEINLQVTQFWKKYEIGYISYVRGENPYTFPLRIWPKEFESKNNIQNFKYPLYQLNNNEIFRKIEMLSLFMVKIGEIQNLGYNKIIESTKNDIENNDQNTQNFQDMGKLGYTILQRPLEALNIIYPSKDLLENKNIKKSDLVGSVGLNNIMKYDKTPLKRNFEYKSGEFEGMFNIENIGLYSSKIKNICESIQNSEGVILVYSQYIDGGIIPLALSFILLLWVPPFEGSLLFIFLLAVNLVHRTCFTIVSVPYSSLTARITDDSDERTKLTKIPFNKADTITTNITNL